MSEISNSLPIWLKNTIEYLYLVKKTGKIKPEFKRVRLLMNSNRRFAPIYDNGSSLGRELTELKIKAMLKTSSELESYINRGRSEIHWGEKKIPHFQFIKNLKTKDPDGISNTIKQITGKYSEAKFGSILDKIDSKVPEGFAGSKLPNERKELILKMVTLRIEKLKEIVN